MYGTSRQIMWEEQIVDPLIHFIMGLINIGMVARLKSSKIVTTY